MKDKFIERVLISAFFFVFLLGMGIAAHGYLSTKQVIGYSLDQYASQGAGVGYGVRVNINNSADDRIAFDRSISLEQAVAIIDSLNVSIKRNR